VRDQAGGFLRLGRGGRSGGYFGAVRNWIVCGSVKGLWVWGILRFLKWGGFGGWKDS